MPTPKFANLQAILAEESEPETGVVSERAEERLEAEMRKVLIDFFERFFLWLALEAEEGCDRSSFRRAEKYLKSKYKAHFTEYGTRQWSEEAAKACLNGAGMHWRYENALYVTALRARMRSAA